MKVGRKEIEKGVEITYMEREGWVNHRTGRKTIPFRTSMTFERANERDSN